MDHDERLCTKLTVMREEIFKGGFIIVGTRLFIHIERLVNCLHKCVFKIFEQSLTNEQQAVTYTLIQPHTGDLQTNIIENICVLLVLFFVVAPAAGEAELFIC